MRKTVIIGLDGASLDFILKWTKDGELPVLKNILDKGFYCDLESTIPPWTGPAWTSLTTGKNPGKTNIFDFFKFKDNGYEKTLISPLDNRAKHLWDYLSEKNVKSIVINVPITHPRKGMNGILIPGYLSAEVPTCYPPEILKEYEMDHGKYKVYSEYEIDDVPPEKKLEGFVDLVRLRKKALLYFSSKYEWDFLMVVFQKTDTVFHEFSDEKDILKVYREVDTSIGEFLENIGNDVNVLFVSDHGMGVYKDVFYVNTWLKEKGLLKPGKFGSEKSSLGIINLKLERSNFKEDSSALKLLEFSQKIGMNFQTIDRIHLFLKKKGLSRIIRLVPKTIIRAVLQQEKSIDYKASKAFYRTSTGLGIRINLKGREQDGIVEEKEYDELRGYLIRELKNLKDTNGEKVFEKVLHREECYSGNFVKNAPDVMLLPRNMDYYLSDTIRSTSFIEKEQFNHKMNGMFIAIGPDIAKSKNRGLFSLLDITPTVLYMFGQKTPDDMDGRVLTEIFREDSELARSSVKYVGGGEKERIRDRVSKLKF